MFGSNIKSIEIRDQILYNKINIKDFSLQKKWDVAQNKHIYITLFINWFTELLKMY